MIDIYVFIKFLFAGVFLLTSLTIITGVFIVYKKYLPRKCTNDVDILSTRFYQKHSYINRYSFFKSLIAGISLLFILIFITSVFFVYTKYLPRQYANVVDSLPTTFYQKNDHPEFLGLYKYFDKVYAVAMPIRQKLVTNMLNKLDTKGNILQALHKDDLKNIAQQDFRESHPFPYYYGEIGCYYSHRQILKDCVNSNASLCAIFEDDAIPTATKEEIFNKIENGLKEVPKDWDMLYLGVLKEYKTPSISPLLEKSYYPYGTHAYIVSRKGAIKILEMTGTPMSGPLDAVYAKNIRQNKLNAYAFKEDLFVQDYKEQLSLIRPKETVDIVDYGTKRMNDETYSEKLFYYGRIFMNSIAYIFV